MCITCVGAVLLMLYVKYICLIVTERIIHEITLGKTLPYSCPDPLWSFQVVKFMIFPNY